MKRFPALAAVAIALSVGACGDTATGPEGGTMSRQFRWEGSVTPSERIEIRGVNGGIWARRASGSRVLVTATIYGDHAQIPEVSVEAVRHEGGVTVCARYPDHLGQLTPCLPDIDGRTDLRQSNVRVEFTVEVPDGVALFGSTVNGAVTADDLHADAYAMSVNGNIDIVTEGIAEALTVNGSITASVGGTSWGQALQFATVNGSVRVAIRRDADVRVEGSTLNGRIATDLPLTITNAGSSQQIRGSLGSGTWNLLLSTVNGDISLSERR